MPRYIKFIGYFGNGALALIAGVVALVGLGKGQVGPAMFVLAIFALAVFNFRVISKAAAATSEEEWLEGEIRKAEMRRQLIGLAGQGLTDVVPPEVMAKQRETDVGADRR